MTKTQLKESIKSMVRESIDEATDKSIHKPEHEDDRDDEHSQTELDWEKSKGDLDYYTGYKSKKSNRKSKVDEAGLTSESVPSGFGPGEKHEKVTKKIMAQYGANDPRTFATLQKIKKGMNEGTIDEASYKVVSPTQARCTKCNQALSIQTDPMMTEGTENLDNDGIKIIIINVLKNINVDLKKLSQQQLIWKLDLVRSTLSSLINEPPLKPDEDHRDGRDYNDGHDGPDETDYDGVDETKKVSEAAYKTVATKMATDAKEDKARRIQTEPKVNEDLDDNSQPTSKVGSCGWENGKAWHHDHKTGKKVWSPNIKTGKIPKINEPKVNETVDNKKSTCQACKGKGAYTRKLKNHSTGNYEDHYAPCDFPGCHNGQVDHEENRRATNEMAYKVQGPSGKTFMDSPQLPAALNNPKNA